MKLSIIFLLFLLEIGSCVALAQDSLPSFPNSGQAPQAVYTDPGQSTNNYSTPSANQITYPQTMSQANPATLPPQQYQSLSSPVNGVPIQPDIVMPGLGNRLSESAWYARVDYFNWTERADGMDFVNEYGTLITLGYQRRIGLERFHAAVFGATMQYKGFGQFDDGSLDRLYSATGYIGVLGEYDLHFEPQCWPEHSFFVGIGTRLWVRDLKDGITESGFQSWGYQETWWTFYPYIGVERKHLFNCGIEFYSSARIGCTAFTYQHSSWEDVALYPKAGLMGQAEIGLRSHSAFISVFSETMYWERSDAVRDLLQPYSEMVTLGMKAGFNF